MRLQYKAALLLFTLGISPLTVFLSIGYFYDHPAITTHAIRWTVSIGILSISIITIAVWLFSQRISTSLIKLAHYAEAIGRGKFETKMDLVSNDEVGRLAHAFNKMATNLRQTTISRDLLVEEIALGIQAEMSLREEITLRKQIEELLRHERDRAELYLDIVGVLVVALDTKGRVILINRRGCELLGFIENEILGRDWFSTCVPADSQNELREAYQQLVNGQVTTLENQYYSTIITKQGEYRTITFHYTFIHDESSHVNSVLFSGEDITERKQVEETLQKLTHQLSKRVKELGCLYNISDLIEKSSWNANAIDTLFEQVVNVIPSGWQYSTLQMDDSSSVVCVQIVISGKFFRTKNFKETPWQQTCDLLVHHQPVGTLVVGYLSNFSQQETTPFLEEEQHLLNAIAGRLGRVIERQQVTEALEKSEERYRLLIETIPYGILEIDAKGKIIFVNTACTTLLGYTSDELLDKIIWNLLEAEKEREELKAYFHDILKNYPLPSLYFITLHSKTGRLMDIQVDWNYKRDDQEQICGFIVVITDITERKQAEEKIRKLSRAVEQSPSTVVITDLTGAIEYVNPKFTQVTGYNLPEVIGRNPRILKSGEIPKEEYQKLWDTISSGQEWRGEFHNRKKDGELYWEFASISPIFNADNQITHYLAVKENITERKRIEQQLAEERLNLERIVEMRTQELRLSLKKVEEVNWQLEQANRAKSHFLSSISHELRTPLNAILGFTDLLSEQFFGRLNDRQIGYVKQIDQSGKHLLSLINDLLDMTKIDAGAMELELREVAPNDFIDPAIFIMVEQFRKKNIKLERFIDPTLTLVTVDVRRCKQIMLNLLSNAFKYTPSGGQVTIQAIKEESHFKVTVSDSGIGIEARELDKIFLEFYQTKGPHQEVQLSGTGIGLALTRRLVELHGGEIRATSILGQGSTFWFTIPLKNCSLREIIDQPQSIETVDKQKNGRHILIAEDNSTNLMMILDMLNVHGHQVIVARNGQEAIDLTELYKPELILMDMQMPIMDGLEATRRLRKQFVEIPIIALTATTGSDAIKQQLMAGCVDHLAKPIQSKELFRILQRYLT